MSITRPSKLWKVHVSNQNIRLVRFSVLKGTCDAYFLFQWCFVGLYWNMFTCFNVPKYCLIEYRCIHPVSLSPLPKKPNLLWFISVSRSSPSWHLCTVNAIWEWLLRSIAALSTVRNHLITKVFTTRHFPAGTWLKIWEKMANSQPGLHVSLTIAYSHIWQSKTVQKNSHSYHDVTSRIF